jgi:hypothetical protein
MPAPRSSGLLSSALVALALCHPAARAQSNAAEAAPDGTISRVEDFLRVAADGEDAADIRALISSDEALAQAGYRGQLPRFAEFLASNAVDVDELVALGRLQRLAANGLVTGYDLCYQAVGDKNGCAKQGTIGYGLCVKSSGQLAGCDPSGSLGYALCVQHGGTPQQCKTDGSVGYGLCVKGSGQTAGCSETATQSDALCALKNHSMMNCK